MVALVGQAIGLVALAADPRSSAAPTPTRRSPARSPALFGAVAILSFYRALALGTMSIVAPIVATSAIVPVLAGVVDGERPGTLQWVGIVAALAGVALASREPGGDRRGRRARRSSSRCSPRSASASRSSSSTRAAEHDALTGVAAARAVAVPILVVLVLRRRAPARRWRALPKLGGRSACSTPAPTPRSRSPPPAAC